MDKRQLMKGIMASLQKRGADEIELWLSSSSTEEFNVVYKELNLLRSIENQGLSLTVFKDQKKADTDLNQFDEASIKTAIDEIMSAVESSNADSAFGISPKQSPQVFSDGPEQMDADKIVYRLEEFTKGMKQDFPNVSFDASLSYKSGIVFYLNSNGVDFETRSASYSFMTMFTAKIGRKMSSLNYTSFELANLDQPLLETNFTRELMRQISEQTETSAIPKNFSGDVIMFPAVAGDLLDTLINQQFGGGALLTQSSRFPDHIGKKILDEKLSAYIKPTEIGRAHV